ncbi:MAG: flagellar biosynthesis protein FlgL [Sulfurimonas sp.]|nr:flagellar biosynthesis protein FlgL [Sulfurimonas sp.]
MRITSSMYYKDIYEKNNSILNKNLFDVNQQISSGLKIHYAKDDVGVFADTMRLDNEIVVLGQIQKSVESGYKVSTQTDTILSEFTTSMDRMRSLFISAANDSNSDASRDATAQELRGLEDHLKTLANSSINGKYLFSGSSVDVRPITEDGAYVGNDIKLNSFTGSGTSQQYNITGNELFLGEKSLVRREVTTNVVQNNLTTMYPDFADVTILGVESRLTKDNTIRDLMGDTDNVSDALPKHHFYVRGTNSGGETFKEELVVGDDDTIDALLTKIGNAYGNTPDLKVVNVSMNTSGQIVIEDKMKGSSSIEFHMIGAVDYDQTDGNDAADINDGIYNNITDKRGQIDNLNVGETNFDKIMFGTSEAANSNLYVKSFIQSPFPPVIIPLPQFKSEEYAMDLPVAPADTLSITVDNGDFIPATTTYNQAFNIDSATTYDDLKNQIELAGDFTVDVAGDTITLNATAQGIAKGVSISLPLTTTNGAVTVTTTTTNSVIAGNIDAILYDRVGFTQSGSKLSSTTAQIIKDTNAFATASTKLSEVADITKGTSDPLDDTLDGTTFNMEGKDIYGNVFSATIDLLATGSTFTVFGNTYDIFDMGTPRAAVAADDITYKQFMDVINMVITKELPTPSPAGSSAQYDGAIAVADLNGRTYLGHDGKIQFGDTNSANTKARLAIYDSNSGDFNSTPPVALASVMTFNSNDAITVRDPKTDFFNEINKMISAVENYNNYPDSTSDDMRNIGIENAVTMLDDLQDHVYRAHAQSGAQSNSLNRSLERASMLEMSTVTLRSSVIDTDLAEASLTLTQLSLNYQAMLSTVGKISQLSLVNYL